MCLQMRHAFKSFMGAIRYLSNQHYPWEAHFRIFNEGWISALDWALHRLFSACILFSFGKLSLLRPAKLVAVVKATAVWRNLFIWNESDYFLLLPIRKMLKAHWPQSTCSREVFVWGLKMMKTLVIFKRSVVVWLLKCIDVLTYLW